METKQNPREEGEIERVKIKIHMKHISHKVGRAHTHTHIQTHVLSQMSLLNFA